MDILKRRLHSQRLVGPIPATAAEVVRWMGAVQAQDYAAARWAIASARRVSAGPTSMVPWRVGR